MYHNDLTITGYRCKHCAKNFDDAVIADLTYSAHGHILCIDCYNQSGSGDLI